MKKILLIILAVLSCGLNAASIPETIDRCAEDNLSIPEAKQRNRWASKCFPDFAEELRLLEGINRMRYITAQHSNGSYHGPLDITAPCTGWVVKALCSPSCYPADQLLWFEQGDVPLLDAINNSLPRIMTLAPHATVDAPKFVVRPVQNYTRSWREGNETILTFKMASGGQLRVTSNHPMLTSDGVMNEASKIFVGQSLVKANGAFDTILDIQSKVEFGKVYNVSPESGNPVENILVAQGYLTGSAAYQYAEEFNSLYGRKLLRRTIELVNSKSRL